MRDARLRPVVVMADSPTASGKSPSSELTVALTANCTSSGAVAAKSATSLGGSIPRSSLKKGFVGSASCVAHTGFPANQSESFATPCVLVGWQNGRRSLSQERTLLASLSQSTSPPSDAKSACATTCGRLNDGRSVGVGGSTKAENNCTRAINIASLQVAVASKCGQRVSGD